MATTSPLYRLEVADRILLPEPCLPVENELAHFCMHTTLGAALNTVRTLTLMRVALVMLAFVVSYCD